MRDDAFGLAFLKSQFLPKSPLPAARPQSDASSTSFLSQLNRATAGQLKKYQSPLAAAKNSQLQRPNQRQATSTARPMTQSTQPRTTLSNQSKAATTTHPQTTLSQRPTTTTSRAVPMPTTSLDHPPTSLATPPKTTDTTNALTSLDHAPTSLSGAAARAPQLTTPHPAEWPRLDPTGPASASAMGLAAYPHPVQDNGRGMHWIPTTKQSPATVDRFVAEAQRMGVKWVTFLNDGANVGDNDYLVQKLSAAGIEPVMRIYSPTLQPLQGDIEGMVRHYSAKGVHYFQPFNEPNLNCENPDGQASVDRYLNAWVPAAKAIVRGGGLPGFGALAPGGDYDDQEFMKASLAGLKARGEVGTLDKGWISMHNYTWNHPIADRGDGDGFFKFRAYQRMVQGALGRDLPIVGTEGGTFEGQQEDPKMPAVTAAMAADWTSQAFKYMRDQREPWLFASSVWTIANSAGGAGDPRFEAQALFKSNGGQSSIVGALRNLA